MKIIPHQQFCDLKPLSLKKATEKARVLKQELYFKIQKVHSSMEVSVNQLSCLHLFRNLRDHLLK